MSQENVEIIRGAFESWQAGGGTSDALPVDVYAKDVEWDFSAYQLVDLPTRGRRRDNLMSTFAKYFSGWQHYEPQVLEVIDAGEHVVTSLHETVGVAGSD